jgi:hypothetical protein
MDFFTLSLPEAAGLYMGLALQAMMRASSWGRWIPLVMVLAFAVQKLLLVLTEDGSFLAVLTYLGRCLLLLLLFWPEWLVVATGPGRLTAPTQVASAVAQEAPGATVITAQDTGLVTPRWQSGAFVPPGYRLLLKPITASSLAFAREINAQAHRPFTFLMPLHWLLGTELTSQSIAEVADWMTNCYVPVLTGTLEAQQGRTVEELLPWGATPMRQALATREVRPGAQTNLTFLQGPTPNTLVRCDVYLDALDLRVQGWLFDLRSPNGTPLLQVFQEELGMDSERQAHFLIYREMLRAADAAPAPSLLGTYAALRGVSMAGQMLSQGATTGAVGLLTKGVSWGALLVGLVRGGTSAASNEFQRMLDALSWLVGIAAFLLWWMPYILGILQMIVVGFFGIAVLGALIPGQAFQSLWQYFWALFFVCSAPLWWALIDLAQRLYSAQVQQGTTLVFGLGNSAAGLLWGVMITVLGTLLVPAALSVIVFRRFHAIGSMVRSGL